jgi:hypothetical protein
MKIITQFDKKTNTWSAFYQGNPLVVFTGSSELEAIYTLTKLSGLEY